MGANCHEKQQRSRKAVESLLEERDFLCPRITAAKTSREKMLTAPLPPPPSLWHNASPLLKKVWVGKKFYPKKLFSPLSFPPLFFVTSLFSFQGWREKERENAVFEMTLHWRGGGWMEEGRKMQQQSGEDSRPLTFMTPVGEWEGVLQKKMKKSPRKLCSQ